MKRPSAAAGFVAIAWIALAACGADDAVDPPQGCRNFVEAWCGRQVQCVPPSDRSRANEDCHFATDLGLDCSKIVQLGANYGGCMNDIPHATCPATTDQSLALPASCKGVLLR